MRRDGADASPGHHNIFAVRLCLQTFNDVQLDFGFGLSVELHLIREQANLFGKKVNGLWNAGAGDHNVTVGSNKDTILKITTGGKLWSSNNSARNMKSSDTRSFMRPSYRQLRLCYPVVSPIIGRRVVQLTLAQASGG